MKHEYDLRAEEKILGTLEKPWDYARWFTCYCEKEKSEVIDLYYETREKLLAIFKKYKDGDEGVVNPMSCQQRGKANEHRNNCKNA